MSSVDFDTAYWSDPLIQAAPKDGKLLHAFLWTNHRKNVIGIYQITLKDICNDLGMTEEEVRVALVSIFPSVKYDFDRSIVAVFAHFKRQFCKTSKMSDKWLKAAEKCLHALPHGHPFIAEWLDRYSFLDIPYRYPIQGISKGYAGGTNSVDFQSSYEGVSKGYGRGVGKGQGPGTGTGKGQEEESPREETGTRVVEEFHLSALAQQHFDFVVQNYPFRNGIRIGVDDGRASVAFRKIPGGCWPDIRKAVLNYRSFPDAAAGFAKDLPNWLDEYWRNFVNVGTHAPPSQGSRDNSALDDLKKRDKDLRSTAV